MKDCITVTVATTKGSVPRGPGTQMTIWAHGQDGTIGGGALEYEASKIARQMLATGEASLRRSFPLGPNLGQCCGGAVELHFASGQTRTEPTQAPLWIWGAGHVGQALVHVLSPLQDRAITWVDTAAARFPNPIPAGVSPLIAADPTRVVRLAPANADHLILTYSHDIDLKLCDGLLRHRFASVGLIGSATKWARFKSRLTALGHSAHHIARITCPIGDPTLGKHPTAIAIGVASGLLSASVGAEFRGEQAS